MREKKFRIDDARQATQAAVRGGISPGGGLSLIKASTEIKSDVSYNVEREFRRATFSIF